MTTEQKEELLAWAEMGTNNDIISYVEMLEKQAAIDALAKAERIEEKQNDITRILDMPRYEAILKRLGAFETYLTIFADMMTPDDREVIAQQFDTNLFESDKAMAERFRNANNTKP